MIATFALMLLLAIALFAPAFTALESGLGNCAHDLANVSKISSHSGAIGGWYEIGVHFLHTISEHDHVPYDTLRSLIDKYLPDSGGSSEPVTQSAALGWAHSILSSQVGYCVALAFGLVFVILMPIVGVVYAVCRCCGACGGKRYQERPTSCGRAAAIAVCAVAVIALASGVALYASSNQHGYSTIPSVRDDLIAQIDHLAKYGNSTVNETLCVAKAAFANLTNDALSFLQTLPDGMEAEIMNQTGMSVMELTQQDLEHLMRFDLPVTIRSLDSFMKGMTKFKSDLTAFLSSLKNGTVPEATKQDMLTEINSYINESLVVEANATLTVLQGFTGNPKYNLTIQLQPAIGGLKDVVKEIDNIVDKIQGMFDDANSSMIEALNDGQEKVGKVINSMDVDARKSLMDNLSTDNLDRYSWIPTALLVFMVPILFIAVFLLIGIICGLANFGRNDIPYKRPCLSHLGGHSQMIVVGVAFLSSSLLMLLTVLLFTVGYGVEEIVCQPVFEDHAKPMYDLISHIFKQGGMSPVPNYEMDKYRIVMACKKNEALFTALDLSQVIDLDKIVQNVSNIHINVPDFTKFNSSDIYTVPADFSTQVKGRIVPALENLASGLQTYGTVLSLPPRKTLNELQLLASQTTLTDIQRQKASDLSAQVSALNRSDTHLHVSDTKVSIDGLVKNLNDILALASNQTRQLNALNGILHVTSDKVTELSRAVIGFTDATVNIIETKIGSCGTLYTVFQNIGTIACRDMLYTVHGLWLGMGWCLLWLIPTIIAATILAKYLHRMNKSYYMDRDVGMTDRQILDAFSMPTLNVSSSVHPASYTPYRRASLEKKT